MHRAIWIRHFGLWESTFQDRNWRWLWPSYSPSESRPVCLSETIACDDSIWSAPTVHKRLSKGLQEVAHEYMSKRQNTPYQEAVSQARANL